MLVRLRFIVVFYPITLNEKIVDLMQTIVITIIHIGPTHIKIEIKIYSYFMKRENKQKLDWNDPICHQKETEKQITNKFCWVLVNWNWIAFV